MQKQNQLRFSIDIIIYPLLFVFTMWLFFWFEVRYKVNLNFLGVYPQKIEGMLGILFSPFVHGSLKHLFNNSVPLLVLMSALFYFYRHIKWRVLILGIIFTGFLTWLIARPAYHIGASGVVYMLASFLFFKGIFSKQYQLIALSLIVVFLYGSLLWYLFPIDSTISWEGHLSGFLVGFVFSMLFKKNIVSKRIYEWEKEEYDPQQDPFMQQFDADGNFIEKTEEQNLTEVPEEETILKTRLKIKYTLKRSNDSSNETL